jgi:polar amino acid transport system substrate-binding protein
MIRKSALALTISAFALSAAIAQDAPLRTALDGNAPPFASPTLSGTTEGLSIDTANEIAKRLGREISIDAVQFSALIPALQAGTYDFLVVPMTVSQERSEQMLFTEGLWSTDFQFVIPADAEQVDEPADLAGKTIAVNQGTSYEIWAREQAETIGWTVESYASTSDSAQAVISGRAAAALLGDAQAMWMPTKNPAIKPSNFRHVTGLVFSYTAAKDDFETRNMIENVIECMKADGTAAALFEKWMGVPPSPDNAAVTVYPGYGVPGLGGYDETPHDLVCS